MWKIITLAFFFMVYCTSIFHHNNRLSSSGLYVAHLIIVNKFVSESVVTTNLIDNHFLTKTYVSSPGLERPSIFITNGEIKDDAINGVYSIAYTTKQEVNGGVVDINKVGLHLGIDSRAGKENNESFKLIFHSGIYSIIKLEGGNGSVLYMKDK